MSYVNLTVLGNSGLEYSDLVFLAAINQTETDWLVNNFKEGDYERLKALSLTKHIKAKTKKEHLYASLRLSDSGKELLSEIGEAPVLEEDEKVANWLIEYYKKADKECGNRKKVLHYIKEFRIKSGIQKNNLILLVLDFLKENEDNSRVLEYIWYKPKTVFATKFDINESWVYRHYLRNEERLKQTFEIY